MAYVIFVFGCILSIIGAYVAFYGYTIVDIERGWTAVISGAVFLSSGVIVMSLAMVVESLNRLNRHLNKVTQTDIDQEIASKPPLSGGEMSTEPGQQASVFEPPALRGYPLRRDGDEPNGHNEEGALADLRPGLTPDSEAAMDELTPADAPVAQTVPVEQEKPALAPVLRETKFNPPRWGGGRPGPLTSGSAVTSASDEAQEPLGLRQNLDVAPKAAAIQPDELVAEGAGEAARAPEAAPSHVDTPTTHSPAAPTQKPVTGRYEADGVAYTMFQDGSIEARSATEVVVYASMEALKASFAERASAEG